jgi:hypothetical protein
LHIKAVFDSAAAAHPAAVTSMPISTIAAHELSAVLETETAQGAIMAN